ncbi:alpha/beta fold hydrolase [Kitasatospora cheerisanensis]|uniref:Putative peptidase S09 family protein n=1 Tax=Kitasatospora cheerisanensis KCTC 2395 TaxID=1348663 RepID=A0A066YLX8_9ACTN|nr:alpha/beta hydrolase [Kitasatospora cheerisanensis]KDN82488.1 putative peptidase S09 family protein [Kitasatospora cheerisanensis KCTC 2395]
MRWGTAAVVAAAAAGAGVGAFLLLGRKVSDGVVQPGAVEPPPAVTVHELGPGRVTLTATPDTVRRGHYALEWGEGGHAVVGEVLAAAGGRVTRRLERAEHGTLAVGTEVRLTPRVLIGDPRSALGLDFTDTAVPGDLGAFPAWRTTGMRGTCVVLIHGAAAGRSQALPVLPLLHALRLPTLTVTYRGDAGAPVSPDGLAHFGETEWQDVDAAIGSALDHGAGRVVLCGWSMGATIALQTAARSARRERIAGLVLDSPVLDWSESVRRAAAGRGASPMLAELGALSAQGRTGVDLADFARIASGADLPAPTLLLQSPDDPITPWAPARRLAAEREDLVSLHSVPHAQHAALWNADPAGYTEALRRFLTPLL